MRFSSRLSVAAAMLLSLTSSINAVADNSPASSRYFEAEDIFALEYATDVQISPDGSKIVYVRASNDIMTDSTRNSLWLLDVRSGIQTPLFADQFNYSQPRWSPDGKQLAFISDSSGSRQLHLHWLAENRTAKLSDLRHSPANLTWSPNGKHLAFTMNMPAAPAAVQFITAAGSDGQGAGR